MNDSTEENPTSDGQTLDYTPGPTGGAPPPDAPTIATSVLRALQARSDSVVGVRIESAGGAEGLPVVDSPEARALVSEGERYEVVGELGRGGVGVER